MGRRTFCILQKEFQANLFSLIPQHHGFIDSVHYHLRVSQFKFIHQVFFGLEFFQKSICIFLKAVLVVINQHSLIFIQWREH